MIETVEKPQDAPPVNFGIEEILKSLPHRYPFLLVDRVTHMDIGHQIKGYKNVSYNDPFFQGHFPHLPIMPGVLIVEALAQIGCILVSKMPEGEGKLVLFAGIDGVRFRRQVVPGDRLDLYAEIIKIKGSLGKAYVKATINDELTADGEVLFSLLPKVNGERA